MTWDLIYGTGSARGGRFSDAFQYIRYIFGENAIAFILATLGSYFAFVALNTRKISTSKTSAKNH